MKSLQDGMSCLELRPNDIHSGSPLLGERYRFFSCQLVWSPGLQRIGKLTPSIPPLVSKLQLLIPSGMINLPNSLSTLSLSPTSSIVALSLDFGVESNGYDDIISVNSARRADDRIGVALDWCARGFLNMLVRRSKEVVDGNWGMWSWNSTKVAPLSSWIWIVSEATGVWIVLLTPLNIRPNYQYMTHIFYVQASII